MEARPAENSGILTDACKCYWGHVGVTVLGRFLFEPLIPAKTMKKKKSSIYGGFAPSLWRGGEGCSMSNDAPVARRANEFIHKFQESHGSQVCAE
jgi:hypothetical protein